jgi:Domain of unknown function (DUF4190)
MIARGTAMSEQNWNGDRGSAWTPDPYGAPQPGGWQQPGTPAVPPGQWYGSQPGYPAPGYGPPPGYPPYGYGGYPPPQRTNGMAIASMVLGILWLYWIGSVLALVFGYLARTQIRERGESGAGMAVAGIVLGWIGVGLFGLVVLIAVGARA